VSISLELPKLPPFTAEDYEALVAPEGIRLELTSGNLEVAAAARMMWHSEIASRIRNLLAATGRIAVRETGVVLARRTVRASA
jgi:hypothetical protein